MTASPAKLVLASASPRRRDLLSQIGIVPDIIDPADVDEAAQLRELPRDHASRLAYDKGTIVAARHHGAFVLSADTVVACGRRILDKAEDATMARQCLALLSGRNHRVYGGICLTTPDGQTLSRLVVTRLAFKRLSDPEVDDYLTCGEWRGKAGGYAIQGRAAAFVSKLSGSYSNVVGLSLYEVNALLTGAGYRRDR